MGVRAQGEHGARMGGDPGRGRPLPHTPPLNLVTRLPAPLPGRPDTRGAMGGSRLGGSVMTLVGQLQTHLVGKAWIASELLT